MKKLIEDILPILTPYISDKDVGTFNVPKNYYEWYYTYGKLFKPKSLLEIGVRRGYSSLSMGFGSGQIEEFYLIDNEEYGVLLSEGVNNIKRAFPSAMVHFLNANSKKIENINKFVPHMVDIVHVDGDHTFEGALNDLNLTCALCKSIIIIDDVGHEENDIGRAKYAHRINEATIKFLSEHKEFVIKEHICSWTGHLILERINKL